MANMLGGHLLISTVLFKNGGYMKTIKTTLITAMLSFAMISYAGIEPKPIKKVITITLQKACQTTELRNAIYDQVDMKFLTFEKPGLYSAMVKCNNCIYKVFGKHAEWIIFFKNKPPGISEARNNHW